MYQENEEDPKMEYSLMKKTVRKCEEAVLQAIALKLSSDFRHCVAAYNGVTAANGVYGQ